jgi:hypothetical protein
MKKFYCDECQEVSVAIVDGYTVGERLLEGVMFRVSIVDNELVVQLADPKDEPYFEKLNKDHWFKEVKEFVQYSAPDDLECAECEQHCVNFEES